jgi:N6-adenosine-specific RNA methylase IME4
MPKRKQKFDVIVADCPWPFKDSLKMSDVARGAEANYDTMTISDIKGLAVKDVCNPSGAVLCLWVPGSLLKEGLAVLEAWGFQHKQTYVWVKTKKHVSKQYDYEKPNNMLAFGMGRLFRQTHEIALIGISNTKVYKKLKNRSQRSVCLAPNLKHSSKPDDLQNALERMFPRSKKLEMFARRVKPGWTCLGNEIDGKDIRVALSEL